MLIFKSLHAIGVVTVQKLQSRQLRNHPSVLFLRSELCSKMCKVDSSISVISVKELTKPEEPSNDDCCRNGCQNCVFDVYDKALRAWKNSTENTCSLFRYDLMSLTKFKPFVLTRTQKLTDDTNLYTFKPQLEKSSSVSGHLPYSAGQYLSLRIDKSKSADISESLHLIRDFTITSLSHKTTDCRFQMIIKLYEGSVTSHYIQSLRIGDTTYWRGPYGDFRHTPDSYKHLIMFCMGTGVAPMFPIFNEIVENEKDETTVNLHFGCRNSSEIIFRDEIEKLSSYWNFNCTYYLPGEKDIASKRYCERFLLSRIEEVHIKEAIDKCNGSFFVLVCGSSIFNEQVKDILKKLNIKETDYYLF